MNNPFLVAGVLTELRKITEALQALQSSHQEMQSSTQRGPAPASAGASAVPMREPPAIPEQDDLANEGRGGSNSFEGNSFCIFQYFFSLQFLFLLIQNVSLSISCF